MFHQSIHVLEDIGRSRARGSSTDVFIADFMAAATASFERWKGYRECEGGEESQYES